MIHRNIFVLSGISIIYFGCATVPPLPSRDSVKIGDIIQMMECEIETSRLRSLDLANQSPSTRSDWLENRKYSAAIELTVSDKDSTVVGVDVDTPLRPIMGEKATFGLSGGAEKTATRVAKLNVHRNFDEVHCNNRPKAADGQNWLIGGEMGLGEWLDRLGETAGDKRRSLPRLGTINYTIEFVLRPNGKINPKFIFIPVSLNSVSPSGTFTAERKTTHKIVFTIERYATEQQLIDAAKSALALNVKIVKSTVPTDRKSDEAIARASSQLKELNRRIRDLRIRKKRAQREQAELREQRQKADSQSFVASNLDNQISGKQRDIDDLDDKIDIAVRARRRTRATIESVRISRDGQIAREILRDQRSEDRNNEFSIGNSLDRLDIE